MPDQATTQPDTHTTAQPTSARRLRVVVLCLALFLLALGVRLCYWQDNRQGFVFTGMAEEYKVHAQVLYAGELGRFLRGDDPPSDANFVKHPPDYPIFEAAVWKLFGQSDRTLRAVTRAVARRAYLVSVRARAATTLCARARVRIGCRDRTRHDPQLHCVSSLHPALCERRHHARRRHRHLRQGETIRPARQRLQRDEVGS